MKVELTNTINLFCKDLHEINKVRHLITDRFVFDNPAYAEAMKNNYGVRNIPAKITMYKFFQGENCFSIPGGAFDFLTELQGIVEIDSITDFRTKTEEIDFEHNIKPRDHQQQKCIDSFKDLYFGTGTLEAMCGLTYTSPR